MNRTKKISVTTAIFLSIAFLSMTLSPAFSASLDRNSKLASEYSLNWSGYAVTGSAGSVTAVTGWWTVPTVTATKGGYMYAAFWAGIDGYASNTVEQAGVLAISNGKTVSYSAWYEFYPAPTVTIPSMIITPGDKVTVTVVYVGNDQFTITLGEGADTFSTTQTVAGAERSSAEWIVERPSIGRSITKLANFGTTFFYSCSADGTGLSDPIDITMVNSKGQTLAAPSSLTSTRTGYSFSLTYYKSN